FERHNCSFGLAACTRVGSRRLRTKAPSKDSAVSQAASLDRCHPCSYVLFHSRPGNGAYSLDGGNGSRRRPFVDAQVSLWREGAVYERSTSAITNAAAG